MPPQPGQANSRAPRADRVEPGGDVDADPVQSLGDAILPKTMGEASWNCRMNPSAAIRFTFCFTTK